MEPNLNRLECKLKEIILDSRDGHSSDYARSLREDHLHGSAFGKNAFTLDDPTTGTTIFMPWKLHRPLETTFSSLAQNSFMTHEAFKEFVDDFGLFPHQHSSRKRDDVLDYILNKSGANGPLSTSSHHPLDFEEFLLALFMLAKYRASVTHTNEQCAFNNVVNSILAKSYSARDEEPAQNLDLNLELSKAEPTLSRNSSKNLDGVIYHESGLIIDTNIGKVYESPRKMETKDFSEAGEAPPSEPVSEANNTNSLDADLVKRLLEVLRDQNLLNDSSALQDRIEREVRLRDELEVNYRERLSKLEAEREHLNEQYVLQKVKLSKLETDLEAAETDLSKAKAENERLTQKLSVANEELERHNSLRAHAQKTQELLVLETDVEVKLFSIFCVYKDEHCVHGEYVVSEEQLITFCVDFGLGETEAPADPNDDPKAKQAYSKVVGFGHDNKLNYGLFKQFLMNLGVLLKPELRPEEAFRYVVFQLVFPCASPYGDEPVKDYHPVFVTDTNDPWAPTGDPVPYQPGLNQGMQTDPNRFVDVEGKVWFNKPVKPGNDNDGPSTPRFD